MSATALRPKRAIVRPKALRYSFVELRIHAIKCLKSTKEVDQDEITLAAIKVEGSVQATGSKKQLTAKAERGDLLNAGKFKAHEHRNYESPRVVARFAPGGPDAGWPRHYHATLLMIERDQAAIGTIVNAAVKSVEKEAKAAVSKAATAAATAALSSITAGAVAGSAVPLIGTAIGAAAGAAVGLAAKEIKQARKDDVFDPVNVQLSLPGFPPTAGEIPGSRKPARFVGFKGAYAVTYSWAVG